MYDFNQIILLDNLVGCVLNGFVIRRWCGCRWDSKLLAEGRCFRLSLARPFRLSWEAQAFAPGCQDHSHSPLSDGAALLGPPCQMAGDG